jgi:lysyl-tRNA synthetase class II
VAARDRMLASKCLHPLPDKHRALANPERVRQRPRSRNEDAL